MSGPKILHIYSGNLYGGIEAMLAVFAKTQKAECEHHFALCFDGRLAQELKLAGAQVHQLGNVKTRNPLSILRARRELLRLAPNYDLVIGHAPWSAGLLGSVLPQKRRVFWAHDTWRGRHFLERATVIAKPHHIIANSEYTVETLQKSFAATDTTIIRYPVSSDPLEAASVKRNVVRQGLDATDNDVVIVMTARLEHWKGHTLLISALEKMSPKLSFKVWIAGGPQRASEQSYYAELKERCAQGHLANKVAFLGQRSDVPALLAGADVHCQPNTGPEPFGVAYIEALYAGLPLVTTRMGAACEIVTDTCGYLTPPGDAAALAQTLTGLVTDSETRRRLASGGPARARMLCAPELAHAKLAEFAKSVAKTEG